jgi:hypothetical protein
MYKQRIGLLNTMGMCLYSCSRFNHENRPFRRHIMFSSVACVDVPNFSTFSHNGHDFRKKKLLIKFSFYLFYNFVWKISSIKRDWVRHNRKCTRHVGAHVNIHYSCQILIDLKFSRQIFEKFLSRFSENFFIVSRFFLCRQADVTQLIFGFRNFSNLSKILNTLAV